MKVKWVGVQWLADEDIAAVGCELGWNRLEQKYVKKRKKKIEVGPVNGASTEVELAIGASAETGRRAGCEGMEATADGTAETSKIARRDGRTNEDTGTGVEQGREPIERINKERECGAGFLPADIARGGGWAKLWTGLEQRAELIGMMCKGRECKGGDEDKKKNDRNGNGEVGWTENNSISLKSFVSAYLRENREIELKGNVVYWEVKGG